MFFLNLSLLYLILFLFDRLIGGLLSAHLLITDIDEPFGKLAPDGYEGQLLDMAHDLASRLLPAFENSTTGIPQPRVCMK